MSATAQVIPFAAEGERPDETAIRDLFARLLAAWAAGDGVAYGALFADDADYVAFDGSRTVGGTEIGDAHQRLFDTWLKGTRLVGEIDRVRFLGENVAVVVARGSTLMPKRLERPVRPSIQTLVAARRDGEWRFVSFQNTRIEHRTALGWVLYGIGSKVFGR